MKIKRKDYLFLIAIYSWVIYNYVQIAGKSSPITDEVLAMMRAPNFINFSSYWNFKGIPMHFQPLYYIFLGIYEKIVGYDVFYLRLLSVFFLLIGSVFFFKICLFFMEKYAAYLALIFFLLNPAIINYCIFVERYSLFVCLSLTTIYFYLSGLKKTEYNKYMIISMILLSATHLYFVSIFVILLSHSLFYFADDFKEWKKRYLMFIKIVSILAIAWIIINYGRINWVHIQGGVMENYRINFKNLKFTFTTMSPNIPYVSIIFILLFCSFMYSFIEGEKKETSIILILSFGPILLSIIYAFIGKWYVIRDTALLSLVGFLIIAFSQVKTDAVMAIILFIICFPYISSNLKSTCAWHYEKLAYTLKENKEDPTVVRISDSINSERGAVETTLIYYGFLRKKIKGLVIDEKKSDKYEAFYNIEKENEKCNFPGYSRAWSESVKNVRPGFSLLVSKYIKNDTGE